MKRLSSIALLSGTALAFVGGPQPPQATAAPNPCQIEGNCTFKKPLLMFVLDNSTAMNQPLNPDNTAWERASAILQNVLEHDNGYIAENFIPGLLRFGHDPDPNLPGTTIAGDTSGLVDGLKLDVPWYAPDDPNNSYTECTNGDAILAALAGLPPPLGGATDGIGAWTHGGLQLAQTYLNTTLADHPDDIGQRKALLVVLTTGAWTDVTGTMQQQPPAQDPALIASDLWNNQAVPTHVVAFGPTHKPLADQLAAAGGTTQAIDAADPPILIKAFTDFIQQIKQSFPVPVCTPSIPRVMVLLDASSSTLNLGDVRAAPGEGTWDQVRDALAGDTSVLDHLLPISIRAEDVFYFGLSVFGSADQQKLVVQYGPCHEKNLAWALDPTSSCEAPGCTDPYNAAPISWTFKDGSLINPPGFGAPTFSHMPRCDKNGPTSACSGSNNATHLGLALVRDNIDIYRDQCLSMQAPFPCDADTRFLNVLITDGAYDSTDAQVQAPLVAMHAAGVVTHVIGYGDAPDLAQLAKMSDWGSGGLLAPIVAQNQDQLEAAFQTLLVLPVLDPCCVFYTCDSIIETFGPESDADTFDTNSTGGSDDSTTTDADTTTTDATTTSMTGTGTPDTTSTTGLDPTADPPTTSSTPTSGPTTTGDPPPSDATTADNTDTDDPSENASDKGCGCTSTDTRPTPSLLLLGLLGLRRRRIHRA